MHRGVAPPSGKVAREAKMEEKKRRGTPPKPQKARAKEPDEETRARAKGSKEHVSIAASPGTEHGSAGRGPSGRTRLRRRTEMIGSKLEPWRPVRFGTSERSSAERGRRHRARRDVQVGGVDKEKVTQVTLDSDAGARCWPIGLLEKVPMKPKLKGGESPGGEWRGLALPRRMARTCITTGVQAGRGGGPLAEWNST